MLREPYRSDIRLHNLKGQKPQGDLSTLHEGKISHNAKIKMRNAILWLDASALWKWHYSKNTGKFFRWRLNFIHLTIPAQDGKSDKFVKKVLNRFFLYAFRKTGMRSYIWKAEPQERGEIHFHITSDCFIWKTQLQNIWNGCLRYYGLIGNHENPPSTRVHPTHNIKLMTAYLVKYMTKNDESRRKIQGRLWGCSRNLSSAKTFHITFPEEELGVMHNDLSKDSLRVDQYDWLTVFNLKPQYFNSLKECEVLELYRQKLDNIRKGYQWNTNLFTDENGNPISYQNACKMRLAVVDKMLYEEQNN